jgi:hypothetical protein
LRRGDGTVVVVLVAIGGASIAVRERVFRIGFDRLVVVAIELDPNFVIAHNFRGIADANKGEKSRAIADFRKTLELDPNNSFASDGLKRLGLTR